MITEKQNKINSWSAFLFELTVQDGLNFTDKQLKAVNDIRNFLHEEYDKETDNDWCFIQSTVYNRDNSICCISNRNTVFIIQLHRGS